MNSARMRDNGRTQLRSHVGPAATALFLLSSPSLAVSQEQAPPAPAQGDLEQIFVTGSRIARPDFASASPIVSITSEAFERSSSLSVEDVVSKLPQFTPDMGSTSNNPGNGGQSNVQLRGLGVTSTLVLLDGRRIIPANGNGVVDVNLIPPSLVERVEIVTGGASAVYGSDAIAGVVNFKLKKKLEGLQFDVSGGLTERGDGEEYSAGLTGGLSFSDGRGQAYGYVGYAEREAVAQSARDFSAVGYIYIGPGLGTAGPGNAYVPGGNVLFIPDGRAAPRPEMEPDPTAVINLFAQQYGITLAPDFPLSTIGFNDDGSVFLTGNGRPGSVVNYRGTQDPYLHNDRAYSYNVAPWNYLQLPTERVSAFGRASFEISPSAEVYAQLLYGDYSASVALAPAPAFPLSMPRANPYIPVDYNALLDSRSNASSDVIIFKRLTDLGPRTATTDHTSAQVTAGLRGSAFGSWTYDAYVQTGTYDATESQSGLTLRSTIGQLTGAPDGGVSACGGLDLFGPDSISPACAKFITTSAENKTAFDQTLAEVTLTGAAFALPAGEVGLAFGLLYKRDEYSYRADPKAGVVLADGFVDIQGFNAGNNIGGSDHNTDAYVEALIPLVRDAPGVKRLEAVLGYRYTDYASAGGADAYKAELMYQPVQHVRVRSSFQHAVRAPSIFELYEPLLPTQYGSNPDEGGILDPCTAGSPQRDAHPSEVEALCIAQGLPEAALAEFSDADGLHYGVVGGNPALDPETADTVTVGFALQSWSDQPLLASMQFSLDWYRIELTDAISQLAAEDYIPLCFDPQTNPNFSANYDLCTLFARDPVTGEIADLQDIRRNIVGYEVSGVDAQFDWSVPAGRGEVGFNLLASWLDEYVVTKVQGLPSADEAGEIGAFLGASRPEWKWNFNVGYALGAGRVAAQWRYIDGMTDRGADYEVSSRDYFDAFASYEFVSGAFDGLTVRAGIENIADTDPPLLPSPVAANTDPSQYDVLGRRYSLSAAYRF